MSRLKEYSPSVAAIIEYVPKVRALEQQAAPEHYAFLKEDFVYGVA